MKLLPLLFLIGCAQVTSLNMRKHEFGILPTKIIWFQVAGLEEEQIAMLRFQQPAERRTSFEENICIGKSWAYNLYRLRSPAQSTFMAQITGKKNIKLSCEDTALRPVWSYLSGHGYSTGIIESGARSQQSLYWLSRCGERGSAFLGGLYMWLGQEPVPGASTFHYSQEVALSPSVPFYDRSCSGKGCSSTISENLKAVYQRFRKVSQKHLLIVRDFSYLAALERKDFQGARRILADLESAYAEALALSKASSDQLVLLTTGDSRYLEMPEQGRSWYEFEKSGANAELKKSKLTNLVLANGARAENFCGIYEDVSVFERLLSGPKQQGLELKIINPFK